MAHIQTVHGETGLSVTTTLGNSLVLTVTWYQSVTITAISSTVDGTPTFIRGQVGVAGFGSCATYWIPSSAGGSATISVTFSASAGGHEIYASEFDPLTATDQMAGAGFSSGDPLSWSSGFTPAPISAANELLYGVISTSTNDPVLTPTAGEGWTVAGSRAVPSSIVVYKYVSAISTYQFSATLSIGSYGGIQLITFTLAATGGAAVPVKQASYRRRRAA